MVAAGAVARKWLRQAYGTVVRGHLEQLGSVAIPFVDWDEVGRNPFFAPNAALVPQLEQYMDALRKDGDSCGARLRVCAGPVPAGLGAPLAAKLDADIAGAMMGINAVKGVEIGEGLRA